MFAIEEIIHESITGTLTFDRAFIRLRRGIGHPIKNWNSYPSTPSKCTTCNRELGWKSAIQTLVHQFQLVDVYIQDAPHIPLLSTLNLCTSMDESKPDRPLLIIAKNLPIPVPNPNISAVVLLLEEPTTTPHFETILIAKELEGVSSPIFQSYLQDFYLLHPWQHAISNNGVIEIWDLINGLDQLRVQTLWKGSAGASKWLRLVGHIGDPTHTPSRTTMPPIDITCTPLPPYQDPHAHMHHHEHTATPSIVLRRVQQLCDALRFIPPEKYIKHLHCHMSTQTITPFIQQIFERTHPNVDEEPTYKGSMLIIAPEEPYTHLFGLVCIHLLQGWHVALYPSGSNAEACAFLAQIAHRYQLPISLQTRFPKVSRILATDPLPEDLQWMYGDPRLETLGRRFSMAWCAQKEFRALAWSLRIYEGMGSFAPAGVLCSKDIDLEQLRTELRSTSAHLPYTTPDAMDKQLIHERFSIAKQYGHCFEEEGIVVLPITHFLPYPCPQIVTLYPVEHAQEAFDALLPYRGWLNFLGSDDIQYPHHELSPNTNLLALQQLFRAVLPISRLQDPPLDLWLDDTSHSMSNNKHS